MLTDDKIWILSSWIMFPVPLARLTDKNFTVKFLLLFFQSFFHFGSFQPSVPVNTQVRRHHTLSQHSRQPLLPPTAEGINKM